jgi:uncharacterized membrane protein
MSYNTQCNDIDTKCKLINFSPMQADTINDYLLLFLHNRFKMFVEARRINRLFKHSSVYILCIHNILIPFYNFEMATLTCSQKSLLNLSMASFVSGVFFSLIRSLKKWLVPLNTISQSLGSVVLWVWVRTN